MGFLAGSMTACAHGIAVDCVLAMPFDDPSMDDDLCPELPADVLNADFRRLKCDDIFA